MTKAKKQVEERVILRSHEQIVNRGYLELCEEDRHTMYVMRHIAYMLTGQALSKYEMEELQAWIAKKQSFNIGYTRRKNKLERERYMARAKRELAKQEK